MLLWLQYGGIFDPENSNQKLKELNALAEDPELWNDQVAALKLMKERTYLDQRLSSFNQLELEYKDIIAIIEIAEQDNDEKLLIDAKNQLLNLNKNIKKKELESLLSEEADKNDCFIEINAGAGGTESQDWVQMLLRMYSRWADKKEYKIIIMDENPGEEAGIKSVCIKISGINAYGWLKTESGVHRFVRISLDFLKFDWIW